MSGQRKEQRGKQPDKQQGLGDFVPSGSIRSLSPRRVLGGSGVGDVLIAAGSTVEGLGGPVAFLAGVGLELVGLWNAGKRSVEIREADQFLKNDPVKVAHSRRIRGLDIVLGIGKEDQDKATGIIQEWRQTQHKTLVERVKNLNKTKRGERIHAVLYPISVAVARLAGMTTVGLLKTGIGLAVFSHPELVVPAFLAAASPLSLAVLGISVAAAVGISIYGLSYLKDLINRYQDPNAHKKIDIVANEMLKQLGQDDVWWEKLINTGLVWLSGKGRVGKAVVEGVKDVAEAEAEDAAERSDVGE